MPDGEIEYTPLASDSDRMVEVGRWEDTPVVPAGFVGPAVVL